MMQDGNRTKDSEIHGEINVRSTAKKTEKI